MSGVVGPAGGTPHSSSPTLSSPPASQSASPTRQSSHDLRDSANPSTFGVDKCKFALLFFMLFVAGYALICAMQYLFIDAILIYPSKHSTSTTGKKEARSQAKGAS